MSDTRVTPASSERTDAPGEGPLGRIVRWLYLIGGSIGLLASFVLMVEKIALIENPSYVPTCSLNPVLSCGSVMTTPQAAAFGVANPLLGITGFAIIVTVGVVLTIGFRPPRWFWLALQAGTTFGVLFVHWLIWQSLYTIGALCPYCMVVWAVTIPLFWYTTLHNLERGHFSRGASGPGAVLARYHSFVLALWFVAIIALIAVRFWDYWVTLV
ncbi:vitamin K epoxide reductase family protein [Haloechinothrix halophila]|uniref:vitamin K epoxide reductase family protein n=1 Tax=Haloechinothrix halophila TaxID=1069073 RepID=UPI00042916CD